jgi:hypothetical protein
MVLHLHSNQQRLKAHKDHHPGRAAARRCVAAARWRKRPLDADLPRQDIATYREDGDVSKGGTLLSAHRHLAGGSCAGGPGELALDGFESPGEVGKRARVAVG